LKLLQAELMTTLGILWILNTFTCYMLLYIDYLRPTICLFTVITVLRILRVECSYLNRYVLCALWSNDARTCGTSSSKKEFL